MKKRILSVILASAMALGLCACAGGEAASTGDTSTTGAAESSDAGSGDSYTVGICQLVQHPANENA